VSLDAQLRQAVFARDGGCVARLFMNSTCKGAPHAHHVLPRGRGGTDELDNLVTLCALHHRLVHTNPRDARAKGLLR